MSGTRSSPRGAGRHRGDPVRLPARTFFESSTPASKREPERFQRAVHLQSGESLVQRGIRMIDQVLSKLLLLVAGNRRLPAAEMNLRLESTEFMILAHELADHGLADGESFRQYPMTPFAGLISGDDPLP